MTETHEITVTIPTPIGKLAIPNEPKSAWNMGYVAVHNSFAYTTDGRALAVVPIGVSGNYDGATLSLPAALLQNKPPRYGLRLTSQAYGTESETWVAHNGKMAKANTSHTLTPAKLAVLLTHTPDKTLPHDTFTVNAKRLYTLAQSLGSETITLIRRNRTDPIIVVPDTEDETPAFGLYMPQPAKGEDAAAQYDNSKVRFLESIEKPE